jgi:hypothetical protein
MPGIRVGGDPASHPAQPDDGEAGHWPAFRARGAHGAVAESWRQLHGIPTLAGPASMPSLLASHSLLIMWFPSIPPPPGARSGSQFHASEMHHQMSTSAINLCMAAVR